MARTLLSSGVKLIANKMDMMEILGEIGEVTAMQCDQYCGIGEV